MDAGIFVICMYNDTCDQGHYHTDKGNIIEDNKQVDMRKFNEEDYNLVKGFEKHFNTAIESRYCSGLTSAELDVMQKVYGECLNRQANLSCSGCVLQMITSVGRLYYGYIREQEKIKELQKVQIKERKPRTRRKKNEDKVEHQTGEGMPVALQDNN